MIYPADRSDPVAGNWSRDLWPGVRSGQGLAGTHQWRQSTLTLQTKLRVRSEQYSAPFRNCPLAPADCRPDHKTAHLMLRPALQNCR
ncbi:MAG UNVERIFIED_CONTAM: hypothetical protein LVR18_39270 [Planctomycetaceae bacterium]